MPRRPEIGNIQLYPNRPLRESDRNGYVLKFYCPIAKKRVRRNCGTRDRRVARRILRECRERLLNGEYVQSAGAITASQAKLSPVSVPAPAGQHSSGASWQECYEAYRAFQKVRIREGSLEDAVYRLGMAERIFENHRERLGLPEGLPVANVMTLEMLHYLQERLLDGDEGRFEQRSPSSVNSMMRAVMAFVRFCHKRGWIEAVPPLDHLNVDEVMKGRPISNDEFNQMIAVTPRVVGQSAAQSWQFALRVLWESGFRVGELMNFSWDDARCVHPILTSLSGQHATILVPSSQKNGKVQEIPLMPGLKTLLESVPESMRRGWIVDPLPIQNPNIGPARCPEREVLDELTKQYSNSAIARAFEVSEAAVRKWLRKNGLSRDTISSVSAEDIPKCEVEDLRQAAVRSRVRLTRRRTGRLTTERVSRVISMIGKGAGVIVQEADDKDGRRIKYASAHDLRRGFAERLINLGVSAETLKVIMRHRDFSTTEKHYGARRSAQSAASEVFQKLSANADQPALVGGLMGGTKKAPQLNAEELGVLKALLARL